MFYFLFLWFMKNGLDHNDIESESKQLDHWNDSFDDVERQNNHKKIQVKKENASKEQLNEAERLTNILKRWDNDENLAEFWDLVKNSIEYINYLKDWWKPKDISKELAFLNDSQRITHTKKEYKWLFEKVWKELNQIDIIKEIYNIDNQWWDTKKNICDFRDKYKKLFKNIKKLQKYEKWEFINFPNWLSFELCKWKIAWWNIVDYYIQTHVKKDTEYYIEYVDSLLNMRELFKSKWINIKYWHRETWLANRKFIEEYEKIRKERKESEWKAYEKSNILKVLEQTKQAVIFEKEKKIKKNKKDNEQGKKSINGPIRFIKENTDLHDFATGKGKDLFYEREMWLDLDKLSYNGKNLRQKSNIWKAKLKIQEFFVKLKKFFAKK